MPTSTPITGLTLEVVDEAAASCLLNDSTVILTCQTDGYPRPNVVFQLGPAMVTPGVGSFERYSTLFSDQVGVACIQCMIPRTIDLLLFCSLPGLHRYQSLVFRTWMLGVTPVFKRRPIYLLVLCSLIFVVS